MARHGTYNGEPGCLSDPALIDAATGEPVGERGQLQFEISLSNSLTNEPLDAATMLRKNTSDIIPATVEWTSGTPSVSIQPFESYILASNTRPGVVSLSTGTSSVACATDDARLSNQRIPTDNSVVTAKVAAPDPAGSEQTTIGSQKLNLSTNKGILAAKIVYAALAATVEDVLSWLKTKVDDLILKEVNHEGRITELENRPESVVDLSWHVGQPLGKSGAAGLEDQTPILMDHFPTISAQSGTGPHGGLCNN